MKKALLSLVAICALLLIRPAAGRIRERFGHMASQCKQMAAHCRQTAAQVGAGREASR